MKPMKLILPALLVSGILIFSGCKKDDAPKVDPRDAFVGDYDIVFPCFNNFEDELEITKDAQDPNKIILNSEILEAWGAEDLEATVTGTNFEIEDTDVQFTNPNDGITYTGELSGDGELNGEELTMDVEFDLGPQSINCDVEGEKK